MSTRTWSWPAALLTLAVGAAGCGGTESASSSSTASGANEKPFPEAGQVLFEESFDDDGNKWGAIDDPQFGTARISGGDFVWQLRGRIAHQLPEVLGQQYDRGELKMRDVVLRAEATVEKGTGVAGLSCRETPDSDADWQWYEFVARDGFAAIRHADDRGNIEVLAETKDVSLPLGKRMTIEASCVNDADGGARLTFSLNAKPLLEADVKEPLDNGVPTLQAYTFPVNQQLDVRWHSFTILAPKN